MAAKTAIAIWLRLARHLCPPATTRPNSPLSPAHLHSWHNSELKVLRGFILLPSNLQESKRRDGELSTGEGHSSIITILKALELQQSQAHLPREGTGSQENPSWGEMDHGEGTGPGSHNRQYRSDQESPE